ncbi:MAG: hypothetical protein AAB316_22645 [Bacteroidota bacterium]
MRLPVSAWLLLWSAFPLFAQINFTANQTVPSYDGAFRPGANMGWYAPWTDDWLADIAAGNPSVNVEGAGVKAFRPFLPEHFLEDWGYDIRLSTFQHYDELGLKDNTVVIGYPKAGHRDPAWYCPWEQSHLFANMYLPIWDGGANGTPVNDQNYYALYVYKMVSVYKDYVGFWEVWNEPDQDYTGNGWKPLGWQGNWWENTPQPCDYALKAPVQHYVRLLRITYEVVKSLDPEAYVAIGGLGYPSFLDVILRNTDNPNGGSPTPEFPNYGGAWFDAFAYHSYPHIDGSLRHWDNNIMGFAYDRHSDAAAAGVFRLKKEFEKVLEDRGYDGATFPRKACIMTEGNLPRFSYGDYIGTPETQRNFILKTLAQCEMNNIDQYDVFIMSDFLPEGQGGGAFEYMGLYKWLSAYLPYQTEKNDLAIAYKTFADLAFNKRFDSARTSLLNMPQGAGGVAFRDTSPGNFTYVLWAKTHTAQSENVTYIYFPPAELGLTDIKIRKWNYSETKDSVTSDAMLIKLLASPIFVTDLNAVGERSESSTQAGQAFPAKFEMHCSPQPFVGELNIQLRLPEGSPVVLEVFDLQGRLVERLVDGQEYEAGAHSILFENEGLPEGVFLVKTVVSGKILMEKVVHRQP